MSTFDPKPTHGKSYKDPKVIATISDDGKISRTSGDEETDEEVVPKSKVVEGPRRNYGTPVITNKQCKVCMSPDRPEIEKLIAYGMSQREVIRQFDALGQSFNKNSMSNHIRKHMGLRKAVIRRIVEKQAAKQFEDIEEVADTLLTTRGILEVMRQRGAEQIIDGNAMVEPETLMKVMDKLDNLDSSEEGEKLQEMMIELNCLLRAVQAIVPESTWAQITEAFKNNLDAARGRASTPPKELTS